MRYRRGIRFAENDADLDKLDAYIYKVRLNLSEARKNRQEAQLAFQNFLKKNPLGNEAKGEAQRLQKNMATLMDSIFDAQQAEAQVDNLTQLLKGRLRKGAL